MVLLGGNRLDGRNYFESLSIGLSVVVLDYTCFSGIGSYSIRVACN